MNNVYQTKNNKMKYLIPVFVLCMLSGCATYIDLEYNTYKKIPFDKRGRIQFYNSAKVDFTFQRIVEDSMDVKDGKILFIDKDDKKLRKLSTHTHGVMNQSSRNTTEQISVQFDSKMSEGIPFVLDVNIYKLLTLFIFQGLQYNTNNNSVVLQVKKKDLAKIEREEKRYKGVKIK